MAANPDGGADGHTGLRKLQIKVIHILSVGMAVEMVRGFCHDEGADGLGDGDGCGGGAMGHFYKLVSTADHSTNHWWC